MTTPDPPDGDPRATRKAILAALEAHVTAYHTDGSILVHAVIAYELIHPGGAGVAPPGIPAYQFSYLTEPETTSPTASYGLAHELVHSLTNDLGLSPSPYRHVAKDDDDDATDDDDDADG